MAATTVTTRAVKGSALTHTEMDANWNNLNNVGVGAGHISIWPAETLPDGTWLHCRGQSIATATYPDLFDVIGYSYGGAGANFTLPDYRGFFLRGHNAASGNDPDAASRTDRGDGTTGDNVGTEQASAVQAHKHVGGLGQEGGTAPFGKTDTAGKTGTTDRDTDNFLYHTNDGTNFDGTVNAAGVVSTETRPKNVSVNFIIKALI